MKAPYWGMFSGLFSVEESARLVGEANAVGFQPGTHSDGSHRDHVEICMLTEDHPVAAEWIASVRTCATILGELWRVKVWPEHLRYLQVSHWRPGSDHYHYHCDHDTRGILPFDRKFSLYASLCEGGGLEIDEIGLVNCNTGDALAFTSIVQHAVPQTDHERYSMVAWVPGPAWT